MKPYSSLSLLLLLFFTLGSYLESFAQSGPFLRPRVTHFGLKEGLPHRSVLSSTHDKDNIQWITTEATLCRDDGYKITTFTKSLQNFRGDIRRNEDSLLMVIPNAYPDSVEIFNPVTLQSSGASLGKGLLGAYAGASQRDGSPLYFAQGGYIYRFRTGVAPEGVHQLSSEVLPGDRLIDATQDGYVLFRKATNQLEELTAEGRILIPLPTTRYADSLFLYRDRSETVWISTPEGVWQKKPGRTALSPGPSLASGQTINLFFEDKKGHLILGHLLPNLRRTAALISFYQGQVHSLDWISRLDNRLIAIKGEDFFKEIEFGSHGGYYRINFPENQATPFRNYLYDPSLKPGEFGHVMRGFTADNDGNVYTNKDTRQPNWFRVNYLDGSLDTLVMRDNGGAVVDHFGCGTNMLNHHGDIFGSSCFLGVTDTAHVYRYRPSTDQWFRWALPETNQKIRWMMPGRNAEEILLVTEGTKGKKGNLFYFSPPTGTFIRIYPAGPALTIDGYTKSGIKDSLRNCVWLATMAGLYQFDLATDSLSQYRFQDGRATEISDIILRENGKLLLGTFKTGLQLFDPATGQFTVAGGIPEDGNPLTQSRSFLALTSNDIASLAVTPEKDFIIPTFNGLSFHGTGTSASTIFTKIDGLPSNEFNTPSLFHNPADDRWYAGGINGFTSFRIADLARDISPYEVIFLRTRLLDEAVGYETSEPLQARPTERLVIPASVAYFSLEYTVPDYSNRNPPRYQTQLVGLDKNWRTPETTPSVRYTQLSPGEYTFRVKAIDGSGRTTSEARELTILVEKHWYETNWFYGLCLLASIVLLAIYIYVREQRLRKDYRAKRRVQQLELKALRQQLNPHFISNAMNAIRDFVYEAEPQQAAVYLNDFARLMRLFLEESRQRFTVISNEVELLERYIRLEQLRFKGKFKYEIMVAPNIEMGMDEVPSLLLQPIVENAINHGLYHLENGGELTVEFFLDEQDDEIIICRITDNGVGRKVAAQKRKTEPGRISRSTQILEDRRRVLEQEGNINLIISTRDLFPERTHTGTQVTIRVEPIERMAAY